MRSYEARDPARELRSRLIDALVNVPMLAQLSNRHVLIALVQRGAPGIPQIEENSNARLHIARIVLACLDYPTGARALGDALRMLAPSDSATRRAGHLLAVAALRLSIGSEWEEVSVGNSDQFDSYPLIWGDVPSRNPHFIGRDEQLSLLHAALSADRQTAVLPQAIHGMGGIGKTQLAIEYAYRYGREMDLVWWIPAEQESQIQGSFRKLARRLGLDVDLDIGSIVSEVRAALSAARASCRNWLLIFDNAESLGVVRSYFPTRGVGKIIITSRNSQWAGVVRALEVEVFRRDESKALLRARVSDVTEEEADRIAAALGDLPLAVEQAAAWHAATGMSTNEYIQLLNEKRVEILDATSAPSYQMSVAATLNVSLDRLSRTNPAALRVLQVRACLAPDPIPLSYFKRSGSSPVSDTPAAIPEDPIEFSQAIKAGQQYSLIRLDHGNGTFQMHRLIQAVLLGRMSDTERAAARSAAHELLVGVDRQSPRGQLSWDCYQTLVPHVIASGVSGSADPAVRRLTRDIVEFLYYWGDQHACLAFAEEAYGAWCQTSGKSDKYSLSLAKLIGFVKCVQGDFREGGRIFEDCLERYMSSAGGVNLDSLDALRMVGYCRLTAGRLHRACEIHVRSYRLGLKVLGKNNEHTLRAANSLGISLRLLGRFDEAIGFHEDVHRRRIDSMEFEAPETFIDLDNLNTCLRDAGRYLVARERQEELYRRSVAAIGPMRTLVLRIACDLAIARRRAGDYAGSLALARDVARHFVNRYGTHHPDSMMANLSLAISLRYDGDLEGAWSLNDEMLSLYRRIHGDDHPFTLSAQVNLAVLPRLLGDPATSRQMNQGTRDRLVSVLGPRHPVTLTCCGNLASDLFAIGETHQALKLDHETLARSRQALGATHPATLAIQANLALDLRKCGRWREARSLLADAETGVRDSLGKRHPMAIRMVRRLRQDGEVDVPHV